MPEDGTPRDDTPRDDTPHLRIADRGDAPAISALVDAAYRDYTPLIGRTPLPMLTDYTTAIDDHPVWVLATGTRIVGVIELIARADHLWVDNVAIEPASQGHGLGRRLLAFADDEARRQGLPAVGLLTNERYAANIAMYERHGFRETRREPHLGTDLVIFRKELSR